MIQPIRTGWIVCVFLGLLAINTSMRAVPQTGWVQLGSATEHIPIRDLIYDRTGHTVIEITIPGIEICYQMHQGIDYQKVSLPVGGMTHEIGKPCLPLITELVAIPNQGDVTVRVLDIQTTTIPNVNVYPFLEPPMRDGVNSEPDFVLDEEIYQSYHPYPSEWANALPPVIWRDVRLAPVVVQPVRWNPATKELTVATRLRIAVETNGSDGPTVKSRQSSTISTRYAQMYADRIINWNSCRLDLASEGSLLIVTHPNFANSLIPFTNWKHRKGFQTTLVTLDEISTNPTNTAIKEYIQNAYYTWDTPPEYVILVGDYNLVPWWNGVNNSKTDHNYSTLEGDDFLPDVVMARFSVETIAECDTLVRKLVDYERNPYLTETGWFDAGMVTASDDGVDPENGLKVRQILINAGFDVVDLFQQPMSNQLGNVTSALNSGRSWAFYIGHGNATSWLSIDPFFSNFDINTMINGQKLPAVVSIACANADLDYSGGDCFGETWMTTAANRGACNFLGFTENCVFFYTDTLGLGIMRSHFEQDVSYFGNNVDYGRVYMYQAFPEGSGGYCERTMQQAMLLGDPTQLVWSDNPGLLSVNHPTEIATGTDSILVTVTMEGSGLENAMVCVMMELDSIYEVGMTDSTGSVSLAISPQAPGEIHLTVTSPNARPYESIIAVNPPNVAPAITDLTATIQHHDIYLSWSPRSDAYEYRIYRSPDPNFEPHPDFLIATTARSYYQDSNVILTHEKLFYLIVAISE